MTGWLGRSREAERKRKRRWQVLGVLLLALAAALYWVDRKMAGRPSGHLGDWLPMPTGGDAHPAAAGTAPAGAEPMAESVDEAPDTVGLRAEQATIGVAEPSAESITVAPPVAADETGDAPEPAEWQEALSGEAPDDAATAESDERAAEPDTTGETDAATDEPDLTPSIATGWVEGDGTNVCPDGYPIKGNANSRIFHRPGESSYEVTIPEICFATEADAESAGYRARKR